MSSSSSYQCFVSVDNKTIVYNVEERSTVYDLRVFVWDRHGIHPDNFYCMYGSKRLKDDDVLRNVVERDNTVRVMSYSSPRSSQTLRVSVNEDINNSNTDTN